MTIIARTRRYVSEANSELKKVTWPTRDQVRNLTVLVFIISAVFGAFIGFFDFVWSRVLQLITVGSL